MSTYEFQEDLKMALEVAKKAASITMEYFNTELSVESKKDDSPVTIADRKAEEYVRREFSRLTPDYGMIGEEFGNEKGKKNRYWVVDPIDGTKSFIHGVPLFGTLLALVENQTPIIGVIILPALGATLYASKGNGCFLNEKKVMVSSVNSIEESTVLDGSTVTVEKQGWGESWGGIRQQARVARGWGDCFGHFLVATGKAEAMFDPVVNIWDVAPLGVILPEAGGRFTSLSGEETITAGNGISTNGRLHNSFMKRLKKTG